MQSRPVTLTYEIDLQLPEEERWSHVIDAEWEVATDLVRDAVMDSFGYDPCERPHGIARTRAMQFVHAGYRLSGGHYLGEIAAWAEAVGVSKAELTFLNCLYELSHLREKSAAMRERIPPWLRRLVRLGCTSGAVRLGDGRVLQVRNMDWPIEPMAGATRIFRFLDGDREFYSVGIPGMVGALSGMVPGAYSATINYAPPTFLPGFDFGPLFLLRRVFETCDTYEDACYALSHTKISANVLFMVCSAQGKACVIERTRKAFARVPTRGGVLAVANHYRSGKLRQENLGWDPDIIADSQERVDALVEALRRLGPRASLARAAGTLEHPPVFNDETRQLMAFDPARGQLRAWSA